MEKKPATVTGSKQKVSGQKEFLSIFLILKKKIPRAFLIQQFIKTYCTRSPDSICVAVSAAVESRERSCWILINVYVFTKNIKIENVASGFCVGVTKILSTSAKPQKRGHKKSDKQQCCGPEMCSYCSIECSLINVRGLPIMD